jgi:hypothetical protein
MPAVEPATADEEVPAVDESATEQIEPDGDVEEAQAPETDEAADAEADDDSKGNQLES